MITGMFVCTVCAPPAALAFFGLITSERPDIQPEYAGEPGDAWIPLSKTFPCDGAPSHRD